ncbi:hypothetical protein ACSW9O_15875 (plasmid) [Clostridium perfringens]|nr:hypothetical protein [Clostridium perfringens]
MEEFEIKRKQIIKDYCKAAELYFLKPWEVAGSTELFKKYNITKDDFIKMISEDIFAAMVIGCEDWKPRFEFSEEEYNKVLEKEQKKLQVWDNISSLPKEFKDIVMQEIEKKDTVVTTWENLDCMIGSIMLFNSLYSKYKNKAK